MGNGHWPFMGNHRVFTWTEQGHSYFLFWLISVFSFSVGQCLPCPWPVDKMQGSPGKVIHQACLRNSTGMQQGLLLSFAIKAKSAFSFCLSLSNQPCESLTKPTLEPRLGLKVFYCMLSLAAGFREKPLGWHICPPCQCVVLGGKLWVLCPTLLALEIKKSWALTSVLPSFSHCFLNKDQQTPAMWANALSFGNQ